MSRASREAGTLAGRVGGALQRLPEPVRYLVSEVLLVLRIPILGVLVIAIAIVVFVPTTLAFEVARMVLGNPTGPIAVVLGLTWLGGSLVLWFVLIVRAYRAIPIVGYLIRVEAHTDDDGGEARDA